MSVSTSVASSLDALASRFNGLAVKLGDFEDCHSLLQPLSRPITRLPRSSPSRPVPSKKSKRQASVSPIRRLSSPLFNLIIAIAYTCCALRELRACKCVYLFRGQFNNNNKIEHTNQLREPSICVAACINYLRLIFSLYLAFLRAKFSHGVYTYVKTHVQVVIAAASSSYG